MIHKIFKNLRSILPAAAIALLWLGVTSSCSKPESAPPLSGAVVPGTTNKFFTAVSRTELRSVAGARFDVVTGADGSIASINLIRDDVIQPIKCECEPGCAPNSGDACRIKYEEDTGWTKVTCLGGCHKSELGGCGGCVWRYPTPGGDSGSSGSNGPMNPDIKNAPVKDKP